MRICLAMGFNIKLSFVICHFSDDNAPLFGDKFSLFSDNEPFSDGAYRGAFLMRKKMIFCVLFWAKNLVISGIFCTFVP